MFANKHDKAQEIGDPLCVGGIDSSESFLL